MGKIKRTSIFAVEKKKVELTEDVVDPCKDFTENTIAGRTLYTLISTGTEINGMYLNVFDWDYPVAMGYAAVFLVEYVGEQVKGFKVGDRVFCSGNHTSYQMVDYREAVKLGREMAAAEGLFARMAGISLATLSVTAIHPPEIVMITGLGCVGIMALQYYRQCGYQVIGIEPNEERRRLIREVCHGKIYSEVPLEREDYKGKVGLVLECSGNEQAVLDGCRMVRPGGEISVIGVPWKPCSGILAQEILNRIFYGFVKIYSGWEHQLPLREYAYHPVLKTVDYRGMSGIANYAFALQGLEEKKVNVRGLYEIRPYTEAQRVYDEIYAKKSKAISTIFQWSGE